MNTYFLSFDFWSSDFNINKFFFGVVVIDLQEKSLPDWCRKIIEDNFDFDNDEVSEFTIKVTCFNNVSID